MIREDLNYSVNGSGNIDFFFHNAEKIKLDPYLRPYTETVNHLNIWLER